MCVCGFLFVVFFVGCLYVCLKHVGVGLAREAARAPSAHALCTSVLRRKVRSVIETLKPRIKYHGSNHVRITEARGRGGGREPPGTHNECRTRATRGSSEARPRVDPGPAGGRVSSAPPG